MIFHEHDPRTKLGPLESPSTPEYQPVASLEQCQKLVELCHDLGLVPDYDVEANYWVKRLAYEEDKAKAEEQGLPEPHFQVYERNDDNERLHILDPRRRLRLYRITGHRHSGKGLDEYGLSLGSLKADERHLLELQPPRLEWAYAISDRTTIKSIQEEIKTRRKIENIRQQHKTVKQQHRMVASDNPLVGQLLEADVFESVSLLETPIKKDDIVPTLMQVVGGLAAKQYLDSYEKGLHKGETVAIKTRLGTTKRNLSSITHRYYGNVGAVVGTKLPVTDEFMNEYFDDELAEGVVPGSVVRLQFDATLKPHTKNPVISRVGTVIYEAVNSKGEGRIIATARKADRLMAQLAIRSMIEESRGITKIVQMGRYELLTGLPSLGKSHR